VPSPIYQNVIDLVVCLSIRRGPGAGPGVLMNISVRVGKVPSAQKILQTLEFRILLYICKSLFIICNGFFGRSQSDLLLRRKTSFFGCKKCNRKCVSVGQFFVLRTKKKIKCNATSLHLTNNISAYT